MPSVRELIATLGFKVDTTPATRFDAAVNRSRKNLKSLTQVRLGRFGSRLKTMFKVGAGGIAALGASSVVAFNKFSDVARGLKQLESQFKGKFKPLKAEIDSILTDKTLGKLTTELELVNTAAAAFELGLDPDVFIRSLRPALEFALVNRKSVSEITGAIAAFIGQADLDLLIKAGQLNQRQIELLKTAGVGPGQAGIIARTARVEELFAGIRPEIQQSLKELVESGVLSQKQFLNTLDETVKELGEKTLPAIKKITKAAIDLLDEFRARLKAKSAFEAFVETAAEALVPEAAFEFLPEAGGINREIKISKDPAVGRFFRKIFERFSEIFSKEAFEKEFKRQIKVFRKPADQSTTRFSSFPIPNIDLGNSSNTPNQGIKIDVKINVESGASADPIAIEQAVNTGIRRAMGSVKEQSNATKLIRGGD